MFVVRGTDTTSERLCPPPQHKQLCQLSLLCCFSIHPPKLYLMRTFFDRYLFQFCYSQGGTDTTGFWWHHQYHFRTCIKGCNTCLLVFSFRYIKTTVMKSPQTKYQNDTTDNNVLKHFGKIASTFLLKCVTKSVFLWSATVWSFSMWFASNDL